MIQDTMRIVDKTIQPKIGRRAFYVLSTMKPVGDSGPGFDSAHLINTARANLESARPSGLLCGMLVASRIADCPPACLRRRIMGLGATAPKKRRPVHFAIDAPSFSPGRWALPAAGPPPSRRSDLTPPARVSGDTRRSPKGRQRLVRDTLRPVPRRQLARLASPSVAGLGLGVAAGSPLAAAPLLSMLACSPTNADARGHDQLGGYAASLGPLGQGAACGHVTNPPARRHPPAAHRWPAAFSAMPHRGYGHVGCRPFCEFSRRRGAQDGLTDKASRAGFVHTDHRRRPNVAGIGLLGWPANPPRRRNGVRNESAEGDTEEVPELLRGQLQGREMVPLRRREFGCLRVVAVPLRFAAENGAQAPWGAAFIAKRHARAGNPSVQSPVLRGVFAPGGLPGAFFSALALSGKET